MTTTYPPATDDAGTVTVFVPLTTTFTAAPSCSTLFRQNGPSLVAYDPGYGLDIDTSAGGRRCVPGPVTTWWEQARLGFNNDDGHHTAASLGPFTCPDGWSTLASSQKDTQSTVAMCCPSGYHIENGLKGSIKGDCQSAVASGDVLTYAATMYGSPSSWHKETTTLTTTSFVGAIAVVGWNIRAATESRPSSTAAANTTPLPSKTNIPSSPPGSPEQQAAENSSTEHGSGTTIGASIGASLGVVALVLAAAWLVVRRRRRRRKFFSSSGRGELEGSAPAIATATAPRWRGAELPAAATPLERSRTEATKRKPASELPGAPDQRAVAELDGGWQQ